MKLRKLFALGLALCLVLALAACGGNDTPEAPAEEPAETSTPAEAPPAEKPADEGGEEAPAEGAYDVNELMETLKSAAGLDATIDSMELDLKAGGVPVDDVEAFAGVEAQNYSDNGGMVLVIQAKPGKVDAVKAGLESFKESRMDDRYAEFATQLANTKDARIVTNGDYAVFAVSANGQDGGWAELDAALDTLFA